jgi:hypothetical protein
VCVYVYAMQWLGIEYWDTYPAQFTYALCNNAASSIRVIWPYVR